MAAYVSYVRDLTGNIPVRDVHVPVCMYVCVCGGGGEYPPLTEETRTTDDSFL